MKERKKNGSVCIFVYYCKVRWADTSIPLLVFIAVADEGAAERPTW